MESLAVDGIRLVGAVRKRREADRTRALTGVFDCADPGPSPIFSWPKADPPTASRTSTSLKEIVMNEELDMELEIVELGDAKEETKGVPTGLPSESDSQYHFRPE